MKRCVALFLAWLVACLMSHGQVTTSSLSGQVCENEDGRPLAFVSVLAIHEPTGSRYESPAGESGHYALNGLRSGGPYTVVFSMPGYAEVTFTDIWLALGENTRLDALLSSSELDAAGVSEQASRLRLARTGSAVNFSRKAMDNMPTIDRSIADMIRYSPYANGMSIAGGDGRMTNFTVDGANFNNNYGLSANLPGGGNPISIESLEEMQLVVSPYDVRQSNFIGGGINAVTKSGSNTFQGTAYTYFSNQSMRGNKVAGIDLGERAPEYEWIFGATAAGPIVKDKLFFFLNYEQENKPMQIISWRARLDDEPAGNGVSRTLLSDMQRVSDFLKSDYGYDPGSATDFPGDNVNRKALVRLDWNINNQHRLALRYNYTFDRVWNAPSDNSVTISPRLRGTFRVGPQSMAFAGNMYSYNCEVHSAVLDWSSSLTDRLSNQLLATFTSNREYRDSRSAPFPHVDILNNGVLEPYMSLGYELYSGCTDLRNRVVSVKDELSFNLGDHVFLAGLSYEYQTVGNLYMPNAMMYYRYKSVDDFLNKATPEAFALSYGFDGVEKPYNEIAYHQAAFYLQDEFRITPRFQLNYGLRLDAFFFNTSGFRRNEAVYGMTFRDGMNLDTGAGPRPSLGTSPRLGFVWDAATGLKVHGGTGLFLGHIPLVYFVNVPAFDNLKSNSVSYLTTYANNVETAHDPHLDTFNGRGMITRAADAVSAFNLPTTLAAHRASSRIYGMNPDFKLPQVWKTTLAVDWTVPVSFPFTLSAEGIFNKNVQAAFVENVNLDFAQGEWQRFAGADNRLIYPAGKGQINAGKTAAWLTNTNQGYGVNALVTMRMTPVRNLDLMASYAFTDMRELSGFPGTDLISVLENTPQIDGPGKAQLQQTQFVIPHKVTASVNYFIPWKVFHGDGLHLNLFYTAFSPYGYSYIYTNDMNQDGVINDLMYIPRDESEIIFVEKNGLSPDSQSRAFWAFVDQDEYLRSHKGQYAQAYAARAPWVHRFDLRIAEDFTFRAGNTRHKFQLSATLMNLTNLLNSKWGVNRTNTSCNSSKILNYEGQNAEGRPTFSMYQDAGRMPSSSYEYQMSEDQCWSIQVGLKYFFN